MKKGDVIVCIDNYSQRKNYRIPYLTYNKVYTVSGYDNTEFIIDDDGDKYFLDGYNNKRFRCLSDIREEQLDKILGNEKR